MNDKAKFTGPAHTWRRDRPRT